MPVPGVLIPSPSQREAIESELGPVLVLAGPGAGKTFCLIERIGFLIAHRSVDPARICALTYTNKAAEEVAGRLAKSLGDQAGKVTRSTIHALCVVILRAEGGPLGIERGFGIADEDYQREILGKFGQKADWRGSTLNRFSRHRLTGFELHPEDAKLFQRYRAYLSKRRMLDFDDLIIETKRLFEEHPAVAVRVAGRWDYLLVDEFQDLNPVQYAIVKTLAAGHRNLFAVGDDEQSIFSWTGADPRLIATFANDFSVRRKILLRENRRTARGIFDVARRFIAANAPIFETKDVVAIRESDHPIEARSFQDDAAEREWLLEDLARDRAASGLPWGDYAVLYRRHTIGDQLEGALMQAGIPCRLAHGRAISDDPVVRYLIAALKVIAYQGDPLINEAFVREVLPAQVIDAVRKQAKTEELGFMPALRKRGRELPSADEDGRKVRRALYALQNLAALPERHAGILALVEDILSQRVGEYKTLLEERAEELSDPADGAAARRLAEALTTTRARRGRILVTPMGGAEIGIAGLCNAGGFRLVDYTGVGPAAGPDDLVIDPAWSGPLGLALTVFKALQLVTVASTDHFRDFVVVDLETTDRDVDTAEIVEVAAVRVRDWEIVADFHRLVKPRVPIAAAATEVHGYSEADLASAPSFESVWPEFMSFAGKDVLVAHNGFQFDFPILGRMVRALGEAAPGNPGGSFTFDTLPLARLLRLGSAKLEHLAERFGIDKGRAHRALSDVRTLAQVFRKLEDERMARTRRTALAAAADYLGVALALSDPGALDAEGTLLRDATAPFALGRYSNALDFYRAERERVGPSAASVEALIDLLGGPARLARIRAEKKADDRYPSAMARVRRLMEGLDGLALEGAIVEFLNRVALSRSDGIEADPGRVNLLTLHSTKGLEFSRVAIVGVEDTELPGGPTGRAPAQDELEESRRLLYVGMTRAKDRLVLTRVEARDGRPTGGRRFLDELRVDAASDRRSDVEPADRLATLAP